MWAKHKKKVYILVGILAFLGLAKFFGLAFTVHGNDIPAEYWTNVSPLKAKLFDKPVFMGFLAAMTLLTLSLAVWVIGWCTLCQRNTLNILDRQNWCFGFVCLVSFGAGCGLLPSLSW